MKTDKPQKNIPNGWQQVKLGDVSNIKMGQSPLSSAYNEIKKGLPLIQGNNDIKNKKTVGNIWTNEITKTAEKGELILTVRAPVGAIGIAHDKICIGRGVCAIESKYKPFIWHFLNYFEYKWNTLEQGSTFTAVNSSDIKKIKLLLPSLSEQNRIVSVLETWDNVIENLNKKIEIKKQIKKGLMQDLLTGKNRLNGFRDKWEAEKLGNLIIKQEKTSRQSSTSLDKGKYPFFNNSSKGFDQYINDFDFDGEMLIANTGGVAYFDYYVGKFAVMSDCLVFTTKQNCKFLFYNLKRLESLINHEGFTGSGIKHLDKKFFSKLKIELPSTKEQNAIAEILTKADEEIIGLQKKLSIIKEQKKYLLNNLITGAIRTPENLSVKS